MEFTFKLKKVRMRKNVRSYHRNQFAWQRPPNMDVFLIRTSGILTSLNVEWIPLMFSRLSLDSPRKALWTTKMRQVNKKNSIEIFSSNKSLVLAIINPCGRYFELLTYIFLLDINNIYCHLRVIINKCKARFSLFFFVEENFAIQYKLEIFRKWLKDVY